jgi:hypothetical protein
MLELIGSSLSSGLTLETIQHSLDWLLPRPVIKGYLHALEFRQLIKKHSFVKYNFVALRIS